MYLGLRGTPVSQYWLGPPAAGYAAAAAQAQSAGYSIPLNKMPIAGGAVWAEVVNPDGTITQVQNWAWPPSSTDASFKAPSTAAIWNAALAAVGLTASTGGTTSGGGTTTGGSGSGSGGSGTGGGTTGGGGTTTNPPAPCTGSSISLGGYCIPIWILAGASLLLLMRK